MPTYLAPGVYFEQARPHRGPQIQRTDVAGFVGLAERGPVDLPVRLTSTRQFRRVFGDLLPHAHLGYAVRAFFENGGEACWVVRVADITAARTATLDVPAAENGNMGLHFTAINPGTWGNRLALGLRPSSRATTHVLPAGVEGEYLRVADTAGLEAGSLIELTQAADTLTRALRRVVAVQPDQRLLQLDDTLSGSGLAPADSDHPISVRSIEFDLLIWESDELRERFSRLALNPQHSRYGPDIIASESNLVRLDADDGLPPLPWPENQAGAFLTGGVDGLRTLSIRDFTGLPGATPRGLALLESVDEVSLLAMPDLLPAGGPPATPASFARRRPRDPCHLEPPTSRTTLQGLIVDAETALPLAGVVIDFQDRISSGESLPVDLRTTGADGRFRLPELVPGQVSLTFRRNGYSEVSRLINLPATTSGDHETEVVELSPVDVPPTLHLDDIFSGQASMIQQCELLRDRFCLLDPPAETFEEQNLSRLQSWRSRFDTAFAALYYPWVIVRDPSRPAVLTGRSMPPSGHIAGLIAATDLSEGVFRPPANRRLRFVEDITFDIDDRTQEVLNPLHINAIRTFPGRGIRPFGARTLSSNTAWQFINVRRLVSMIEEALYDGLQWAVFEPNEIQLRFGLRLAISTFLDQLYRAGALVGATSEAAYSVRCDETTTPSEEAALGRVIAEVALAPTVPYEFIVVRLGFTADEMRITEI